MCCIWSFHFIVLGIQVVQYNVIHSGLWIGIGIHKYLTKYHSTSSCIFLCFTCKSFHCMPWIFSGKGWQLICMQHTIRRDSHASYYHAVHKVWLVCSTYIACHTRSLTDLLVKIEEHMHMLNARECQLGHELCKVSWFCFCFCL